MDWTEGEHIEAAIVEADTLGHPGYPSEVVHRMTEVRLKNSAYPRRGVLRFDRVRADGEILHPYAAQKVEDEWVISVYLPFTQNWSEMPELQFIALPTATPADVTRRSGRP